MPPELDVPKVSVGVFLGIHGRLAGGGYPNVQQLAQERMDFHPRHHLANPRGGIDFLDKDIGGLAHGGVFFDYGESAKPILMEAIVRLP
jgi:hypothetical protein